MAGRDGGVEGVGPAGTHQEASVGKKAVTETTDRKRKPPDGEKEEISTESSAKVKPQDTGTGAGTSKAASTGGSKCPKCPVSFASPTALADHVRMWHRASGAWELAANQAQHQARAYQQKVGLQGIQQGRQRNQARKMEEAASESMAKGGGADQQKAALVRQRPAQTPRQQGPAGATQLQPGSPLHQPDRAGGGRASQVRANMWASQRARQPEGPGPGWGSQVAGTGAPKVGPGGAPTPGGAPKPGGAHPPAGGDRCEDDAEMFRRREGRVWAPSLVRDYSTPLERVEERSRTLERAEEAGWRPGTVTDYTRERGAAAHAAGEVAFQPKVFTYARERQVGS